MALEDREKKFIDDWFEVQRQKAAEGPPKSKPLITNGDPAINDKIWNENAAALQAYNSNIYVSMKKNIGTAMGIDDSAAPEVRAIRDSKIKGAIDTMKNAVSTEAPLNLETFGIKVPNAEKMLEDPASLLNPMKLITGMFGNIWEMVMKIPFVERQVTALKEAISGGNEGAYARAEMTIATKGLPPEIAAQIKAAHTDFLATGKSPLDMARPRDPVAVGMPGAPPGMIVLPPGTTPAGLPQGMGIIPGG